MKFNTEKVVLEEQGKKLAKDLEEATNYFSSESKNLRYKNSQLEAELKTLQHELLDKEELLRTSISMADMV